MSFILDQDTTEAVELTTVPEGEYQIRFLAGEQKVSKKGAPMLQLRFDIPEDPTSKDLTHYMMLPTPDMDAKQRNRRLLDIRNLKAAFGLTDSQAMDFDQLVGTLVWAVLAEEENEEFGMQNRIRRFVTGK